MARTYTYKLLIIAALVAFGTALINFVADPYGVWQTPLIEGLNAAKHPGANYRIQKYVEWARWTRPPQTILLGTSKTVDGLRPDHPSLQDGTTYSMALGGQSLRESLLLFKHALKPGTLRRAVIGLDFFAFNAYWGTEVDYEQRLTPGANLDLLFSTSMLSDSVDTLRQSWHATSLISATHMPEDAPGEMSMRSHFIQIEAAFLPYYHPDPYRLYALSNPRTGEDTLAIFHELLRLSYENNIELHLLISPSHAWHWEGLADVGLWENWEQWKRALVSISEEEAKKAGKPVYPLFDFSGYNSITTEALPDSPGRMKWYNDATHYNRACGDKVLDRLFDKTNAATSDFGVQIDARNIDAHLAGIRSARARYAEGHAADVREMADLSRRVWGH